MGDHGIGRDVRRPGQLDPCAAIRRQPPTRPDAPPGARAPRKHGWKDAEAEDVRQRQSLNFRQPDQQPNMALAFSEERGMLHSMLTRPMAATRRRVPAFTLIELLVVVAIIGVIISILLPALGKARIVSKAAQCLSNQRSIGQALTMYANQYKEWIPREGTRGLDPITRRQRLPWAIALRPFLDDNATPNVDIDDLFERAPYYWDPARPVDNHRIHYVVNGMP